jgi:hypothetical protein
MKGREGEPDVAEVAGTVLEREKASGAFSGFARGALDKTTVSRCLP